MKIEKIRNSSAKSRRTTSHLDRRGFAVLTQYKAHRAAFALIV